MMRSLFSGVSGLKTHQTRMDVIGNNIANVNTTAYKSKSINFSDMLYQTTQSATAPNDTNNTAGTNARQIGLGVKTGAINTSITTEGSSQSTGNPFDLKITGEAFFIVTDGTNQYFTRDGSFNVDAAGNLCMASTGYIVEGWTNTDSESGAIIQDSVQPIKVMSASNTNYPASSSTSVTVSGIIDKFDDQLETEYGKIMNIQVLDDKGYEYNLKFGVTPQAGTSLKSVATTESYYSTSLPTSGLTKKESATPSAYNFISDSGSVTSEQLTDTTVKALVDAALSTVTTAGTQTVKLVTTVPAAGDADYDANTTYVQLTGDLANTQLVGKTIQVTMDDTSTYEVNGTSYPALTDDVVSQLYDATTTNGVTTYALKGTAAGATTLKMVQKQYTEDGETVNDYTFYLADANGKVVDYSDTDGNIVNGEIKNLSYSDISPALKSSDKKTIASYTTTEEVDAGSEDGQYTVTLIGMTDSDGEEVANWDSLDIAKNGVKAIYDTGNGNFISVDGGDAFTVALSTIGSGNFSDVTFDMTNTSNVNNGGKSTVAGTRDDGYKVGTLTGVSIGQDGTITANYDNGMTKTIAQISVATFANSMGLENAGDNLYQQTSNSGEFDGVGVDIKGSGTGYMTTGVLEMSNVDLATEFTNMITTQRGFQANSRIITTSDTLLEELVNLKR